MGAADLPAARADLEVLYTDLATAIADAGPVCDLSGRCCRFREYGHRLFVTDLELATLFAAHGPPAPGDGEACPYQDGLACGAREGRPMGCRLFFCDPSFEERMPALSEAFHARLRDIHTQHGVPYRYGELLAMLAAPAPWTTAP